MIDRAAYVISLWKIALDISGYLHQFRNLEMAFKNTPPPSSAPDSPEKMILDLPRRKIKGALHHQGEVMRVYGEEAVKRSDVALQLPTGSGKTLVGLMIAEWRRRKFEERVVYLCPTKQLVNQVVEQAEQSYGLTVRGFTGTQRDYDPAAKSEYQNGDSVAVTTYSSLFNSNPFFSNADIIIVDDAHAAENYIASMWSMTISKYDDPALFILIANLLCETIGIGSFTRMTSKLPGSFDAGWVDKIPTSKFWPLHHEFQALLDVHLEQKPVKHVWPLLRDHLDACHLYISPGEILLRPLIPPTWDFPAFAGAKQRIFMSATFGSGGDLERLTGRPSIHRVSVPEGWNSHGIGRRYFIFPEMSLKEEDALRLSLELMKKAGRSLVLVPSSNAADAVKTTVTDSLGFSVFEAANIEASKQSFVDSSKAVAVVANRYDGIDFPGDDCRLLFIDGLPRAINCQERFLMSRMGANALYNERVQNRVLQAIGRCTRSLEDYSAVVVSGEDLPNYLADKPRRRHFHPELQAELEFGLEQSKDTTVEDLLDNFAIFLRNDRIWEQANAQILAKRDAFNQAQFPAIDELANVVGLEISYQAAMWQGDHQEAMGIAETILGRLAAPELKGYRAMWGYLAGSAASYASSHEGDALSLKAKDHFNFAKKAAPTLPWLVEIGRRSGQVSGAAESVSLVYKQLEGVELQFEKLGNLHDRKFDILEREILMGLNNPASFESAQVALGNLLGFAAGNAETDAAPDPWWHIGDTCFVFEDYAGAQIGTKLSATKARQVASHPNWIVANLPAAKDARILPILVAPISAAEVGAIPHLIAVGFWDLSDFRAWAANCLRVLRELKRTFPEVGDMVWKAEAADEFAKNGMTPEAIHELCFQRSAADVLGKVSG